MMKRVFGTGDRAFEVFEDEDRLVIGKSAEEAMSFITFLTIGLPAGGALCLALGVLAVYMVYMGDTFWEKSIGFVVLWSGCMFAAWVLQKFMIALLPGQTILEGRGDGRVLVRFKVWLFNGRKVICSPPLGVLALLGNPRGDWYYDIRLTHDAGERLGPIVPPTIGSKSWARNEANRIASVVASFLGCEVRTEVRDFEKRS